MTAVSVPSEVPTETGQGISSDTLADMLAQSAFIVMGVLSRIGAEYELSLTQLRVLGILRDHRPRMAELADFLGLERSTMSGLVDRAEKRGLLERDKNAVDGRAIDVVMTSAGLGLAEHIRAELHQALAPTLDRLNANEHRTLSRLLGRMLGSADAPPIRHG